MWTCKQCGEKVSETFDACWNCGASPDGAKDPNFVKADDSPPTSADSAGDAKDGIVSQQGCGLTLAALFGLIVMTVLMVNAPIFALLIVTNAMFAVLLGAMLLTLFKTGPSRAFAGGLFLGAVAYLIVVGYVLPGENDGHTILFTSVILHGLYHSLVESPMEIRFESYAFMWTGQQLWAIAIGLAAGSVARRMT
jgi:hypothetical protein